MDIKPDLNPILQPGKTPLTGENAVLAEIRQTLGNNIQAQVLQIESLAAPVGQNRWSVLFQILGRELPLQVDFFGKSLPEGLAPGSQTTLSVNPLRGLSLVSLVPPQTTLPHTTLPAIQQALLQSLMSLLPRQGELLPLLRAMQTTGPSPSIAPPTPHATESQLQWLSKVLTVAALPLRQLTDINALQSHLQVSSGSLERSLLQLLAMQPGRPEVSSPPPASSHLLQATPTQAAAAPLIRLLAQVAGLNLKETTDGLKPSPPPSVPSPPRDAALYPAGMLPGGLKAAALLSLIQLIGQPASASKTLPGDWKAALQWLDSQLGNQDILKHPLVFPTPPDEATRPQTVLQDSEGMFKSLLQLISRLQVHQLNSLQQTLQQAADPGQPQVWLAELPIQSDRLHTVQMRLEREAAHDDAPEAKKRYRWTIVLAFTFEGVGHFQTRMRYSDGTVSATVWAEQPATLKTIHEQIPTLREGLRQWGLTVGELDVRHGRPPVPSSPIQRQMIDERA